MALARSTSVISLQGLDALQRALARIPDEVRDEMAQAIASTTFAVAQGVRALVPRASGLLARSITSTASGLTGKVEIGVDAFYWHYLEYGTVHLPARPFIRPAAEAEAANFERRIAAVAKRLESRFARLT